MSLCWDPSNSTVWKYPCSVSDLQSENWSPAYLQKCLLSIYGYDTLYILSPQTLLLCWGLVWASRQTPNHLLLILCHSGTGREENIESTGVRKIMGQGDHLLSQTKQTALEKKEIISNHSFSHLSPIQVKHFLQWGNGWHGKMKSGHSNFCMQCLLIHFLWSAVDFCTACCGFGDVLAEFPLLFLVLFPLSFKRFYSFLMCIFRAASPNWLLGLAMTCNGSLTEPAGPSSVRHRSASVLFL